MCRSLLNIFQSKLSSKVTVKITGRLKECIERCGNNLAKTSRKWRKLVLDKYSVLIEHEDERLLLT